MKKAFSYKAFSYSDRVLFAWLILTLGLLGLLSGVQAGCVGPDPMSGVRADLISRAKGGGQVTELWADWDDIDAALGVGLERSELATMLTTTSDERRTWELLSMPGGSGMLTAERLLEKGRDAKGSERIRLTARVSGSQGDVFARRLLAGMRARLLQLAGVSYAPVK